MPRMDDHELVRIKMGELRRLQKCDHEIRYLRKRNEYLEETFKDVLDLLHAEVNNGDHEEEPKGSKGDGADAKAGQGKSSGNAGGETDASTSTP